MIKNILRWLFEILFLTFAPILFGIAPVAYFCITYLTEAWIAPLFIVYSFIYLLVWNEGKIFRKL